MNSITRASAMRKTHIITLQQSNNNDDMYIVNQLVNCIRPQVGSVLDKQDAERLIARHDTKVTIKRAKS